MNGSDGASCLASSGELIDVPQISNKGLENCLGIIEAISSN